MKTLIHGGHLIDPSSKIDEAKDIVIESGRINAVDKPGAFAGTKIENKIDAKGKWIVPGLIDLHVHLREPGFEHKETVATGTHAAIVGGFTSVACMANTNPVNDSAAVTEMIISRARAANQARVFPIGAVTQGLKGEMLADIGFMAEAGICALSDDGMPVMNSALMRKAMEYATAFDLPIISHAEDIALSGGTAMNEGPVSALVGFKGNPAASEEIMVAREIALARLTGAKLHIAHLSTKQGLKQVERAKADGVAITCEVTPHHLILNEMALLHSHASNRADHKMAPPLRSEGDQQALLEALNTGLIDMVASDHAPHSCVDKETEFEMVANGILGLQTTLPLLLGLVAAGKFSRSRMIELLSANPAKFLKRSDLGTLKVGSTADLTLIDPTLEWTLTKDQVVSISTNSPFLDGFQGRRFKGKVFATMVAGVVK
ncbi:MAG: dihydroorotase [Bdellovibrionales bacterium]|nr:dihydroorotase [Bdellovibrionales bacterium]